MGTDGKKRLIDVAAGKIAADLVISGARVVDVCNGRIIEGDVAIVDGLIAGIGTYQGKETFDANGKYLLPGFIDGHVHIESSLVDPASFSNLVVPHGTTTAVADPHEICNVAGLDALDYMLESSEGLPLSVFFMIPSCVPATPFEHSGAILDAEALAKLIGHPRVLGLGEMMDVVGTVTAENPILEKLLVADEAKKLVDGHGPGLQGLQLNAYAAARIHTDHECATAEELQDRIGRGMYVLLREGSACHDLRNLLAGVTEHNSRMCLFCTDDRQPKSILTEGHIDNHLRIAVQEGLNPLTAIRMATLNAAECYRLHDRGAIVPGRRADLVLVEDLCDFRISHVWCKGTPYVKDVAFTVKPIAPAVAGRMDIRDFSSDKLVLRLRSPQVRYIRMLTESVVTDIGTTTVTLDSTGAYVNDPTQDIVKLAVIERHRGTGNVGLALLGGYGLHDAAIAPPIAHDSHNVIVAGDNDADMVKAVEVLVEQGGGIVMVRKGEVLDVLPLPIAGLMTNLGGAYVDEKFGRMHGVALQELGIHTGLDPFMSLSFMALPVIPHLKVTDMGLFDVDTFSFVPLEI